MHALAEAAHRRARDLAAAEVDFQLRPDEAAALERHLVACATCRDWAADVLADAVALVEIVGSPSDAGDCRRAASVEAADLPARSGGRYNPAR